MGNPVATTGNDIYSGLLLQLVRESTPGTYDPTGQRTVMTQVKGDFVPEDQWGNFRPDGFNEDAWNQLSKTHRIFNGTFTPDFSHIGVLAEMACGVSNYVSSNPTIDTIQETFEPPAMGARSIYTYTVERGTPSNCVRCTYGFVTALSMEGDRDAATTTGSVTIVCRKPEASEVPMTGGIAQNSKYAIIGANAVGNAVVTYLLPGSSIGRAVTLVLGDTALQTKGKFEAFGDGVTVNIVGTLSSSSTNEVQTIALSNGYLGGAIALTGSSSTVSIFPGMTLDTIGTALSTAYGATGAVTVTGTSIAAVSASTTNRFDVSGCTGSMAVFNGTYTWDGVTLVNGAKSFKKIGGTKNERVEFNGVDQWIMSNTDYTSAFYNPTSGNSASGWSGPWFVYYTGQTPVPVTTGPGSTLNLTATFAGTLAGQDVPTLGTTTAGITITTTLAGGSNSGGLVSVEFTAPANTRVTMSKTSGTGYTLVETQVGSDGKFRIPKRVPIAPQSMTYREADTRAGLDTAPPASKIKMVNWATDSLATAEYFASENNLTFDSHTDNADAKRTMNVKMARSGSLVPSLRAAAESQPSAPRWREARFAHMDGKHLLRVQMLASVMGAAPLQAAGNVQSYQFPMSSVLTDVPGTDNSLAITIRRAI